MKHQMFSILTSLSVALAPVASYAGKAEGNRPPKNKCNKEMMDELWRSDKEDLKEEVRAYYKSKERPVEEAQFCEDIASRFGTEATTTCPDGECPKSKAKRKVTKQDAAEIEDAARDAAPRRYREDAPVRAAAPPPPPPAPAGGGFGDMFNGNPMGYMMVGGLGALIGAMMSNNNRQQQPMFRSPYGPYMPGMGPGMMGPGGMRPPPFMPMNRGMGGFGGAPAFGGIGGMGGYGSYAPGVISPYNGANIYNGGGLGGYYGGYAGSAAPAYSTGYFNQAPAVINASTGMRMYSVGGSAPAPTYNLLGR